VARERRGGAEKGAVQEALKKCTNSRALTFRSASQERKKNAVKESRNEPKHFTPRRQVAEGAKKTKAWFLALLGVLAPSVVSSNWVDNAGLRQSHPCGVRELAPAFRAGSLLPAGGTPASRLGQSGSKLPHSIKGSRQGYRVFLHFEDFDAPLVDNVAPPFRAANAGLKPGATPQTCPAIFWTLH
jgi:hypothetical protein